MSPGKLIYIISALIIVACIAGGILVWLPEFQKYTDINSKLSLIDSQIEKKNEYISKLEEAVQKIDLYADGIKKINSALPTDPDISIPPLVDYLGSVGFNNGVDLATVSSGVALTDNATTGLSEYPISLGGTGSYDAVKNLLSSLYNNSRIIDINSISVQGSEDKDIVTFTLNGKTYFYKQTSPQPVAVTQ